MTGAGHIRTHLSHGRAKAGPSICLLKRYFKRLLQRGDSLGIAGGVMMCCVLRALVLAVLGFALISVLGLSSFTHVAEAQSSYEKVAAPGNQAASAAAQTNAGKKGKGKGAGTNNKNKNQAPDPIVVNGQWYCKPPFIAEARKAPSARVAGITPRFQEICVQQKSPFPCSDVQRANGSKAPSEADIQHDWLSGDVPADKATSAISLAGHFAATYPADTYNYPQIMTLFSYLEGISFIIITPSIILLGYSIMIGASSFRYAGALEGLSRVVLGGLAVAVSFQLVQMLILFEGSVTNGIILLHAQFPFPQTTVNGVPIGYTLSVESAAQGTAISSYRGIIVPMSRWGCAANDLMGIFSGKFVTDTIASIIPIAGNFVSLAGNVKDLPDLITRLGETLLMIMSIMLWAQVFLRIIMLNYYILMAPLSFSCWSLPGGVGQRVVRMWFRGFFSVLFIQVVQLFILTTLPLILPSLPLISGDSAGIIQSFLLEFPPILALAITLMAPSLIGASASKVLGTAGSMAGQTIIVLGSAASQMV